MLVKYKHKVFAVLMAAALVALDVFTKRLASSYIPRGRVVTVVPFLFDFKFVYNEGAAFGLFSDSRWIFMSATTVFIVVGIILFFCLKPTNRFYIYTIMLIMAGGIGNMIDRVTTGRVVDFLTFGFMPFPSFNVADICVVIGCFLLIIYILLDTIKEFKSKE